MKLRLAAVVVLALAAPARAGNGDALLADAHRALDDIDFEGARGLITRAIEAGDLDAATLAEAYRMAGEVAAALDDAPAATDAFERWILLAPDAQLDGDESPKIVEPWAAAKAAADAAGAFTVEVSADRHPAKLRLALDAHDPLGMIAGFRVRLPDGALIEHRGLDVELPADDDTTLALTVLVFDDHGNVLAERAVSSEPVPAIVATRGATTRHRFPAALRWPTWATATVLVGAVGAYFALELDHDQHDLETINAEPDQHSFDEVTAVQDRGDRDALLANLAFGVAAAAAITTVITFVFDDAPVEIAPAPGGASAMLRF